jgi:delta1-piperideine-2-carboxylate reductase
MAESRIRGMVQSTGVAVVAIRDSHHFSALWPDIEPFALDGNIALTTVSSGSAVIPLGGREQVMGTNPIAFASPVDDSSPLIFDFATSAMAKGDVVMAAQAGKSVPLGTGVDQQGQMTTDPSEILNGGLLPFGGHKGAALSVMIEILASGLTGGQFSFEVDSSTHPGAETPKTGQLLIIVDPASGGNAGFAARVRLLLDRIRAAGQSRLPGDRLYQQRSQSERDGIAIPADRYAELLGYLQAYCDT